MPSASNVKGALLEELILFLLSNSGYRTVSDATSDPKTLKLDRGMLWVKGRGEWHQIDAIADFRFSPPFSNPLRLLVEGKCESKPVSLGIVRNSVGVHKDVSEFFFPDTHAEKLLRKRYHYQCAIFSGSGFSDPAQNYAYAQDINLLDLNAGGFQQIVRALNQIRTEDIEDGLSLPELRRQFRVFLNRESDVILDDGRIPRAMRESKNIAQRIGFVGIAMIAGIFPIFLVPEGSEVLEFLLNRESINCRIHITEGKFKFKAEQRVLFNFSILEVLFAKCFERGEFNQTAALDMKQKYLDRLEVSLFSNSAFHKCTLLLDNEWLNTIRNNI